LIGTTFAWLTAETAPITNTFTYGDINITLVETKGTGSDTEKTFKMLPGAVIDKDPVVTVTKGSENCWLFIKVEKGNNPDNYLDYSVDTAGGWIVLDETNYPGVYYRQVNYNETDDQPFNVLTGNKVTVKSSLTKTELTNIGTAYPTLKFTAYAVQRDSNIDTVAEAWQVATTGNLT
jgi:hypothetical protein